MASEHEEMPRAYQPGEAERRWYDEWDRRGYFHADVDSPKPAYTIVIPPPNVTGMLTLGHVLNNTLQDILIRWKKMQGFNTCWVPGTDHAGIATQTRVEAHLLETEGLTRRDLGRERFLERVWQWKEEYGGTIIRQLRRLGAACDWQRERFTLDEGLSNAVLEVFIRLYEKGLVYKGHRIINWCPKSRTALSDEEVVYREEHGNLWYFRYPFKDGDGWITVATTRPETMLGDTAVAVNPNDPRYRDHIGRTVILPLVNREIPVIADDFVDPEFGTGAVKVTPAHDPNDYEIGVRHDLPMVNVMNDDATMNENAGAEFAGLDRYECRKRVVERMQVLGLLEKIEDHVHQVGYSERGGVPVEPRLSEQWFVRMKPLAEPALKVVLDGKIRFHPERWVKTYRHWMENIRDWCISRQLWWGHRIPAWYCDDCGEIMVARTAPEACTKCGSRSLRQDEDVLDTWFSSWLWPFSVFGWPEDTPELRVFYPTDALVTGPDIIFFWVARMIMAGLEFMGDIPFKDVYFTSIIRDEQGRKLSKSLGNSPDPIEVIETYGADALRFTMIYIAPVGQDIRYSNEKCEIGRNFANKVWNAGRFRKRFGPCFGPDLPPADDLTAAPLRPDDRWILAETDAVIRRVTANLDNFQFHDLARNLYEFAWNRFCDWYLESAKAVLNAGNARQRETVLRVFDHVMGVLLRLLHPVMPFVTEELWHRLGYAAEEDSIMLAPWPEPLPDDLRQALRLDEDLLWRTEARFELIRSVRNIRAQYRIPPNRPMPVVIVPAAPDLTDFLREDTASLASLVNASELTIAEDWSPDGPAAVAVSQLGNAYVPLAGLIDVEAEVARLRKQEQELLGFLEKCRRKLANENFVSKAPVEVVERERRRETELTEQLRRVRSQLKALAAEA